MNYWVKVPSAGAEEILGDLDGNVDNYTTSQRIALAHALAVLSIAYSVESVREKMDDVVVELEELRGAIENAQKSIESVSTTRYTFWEFVRDLLSRRRRT